MIIMAGGGDTSHLNSNHQNSNQNHNQREIQSDPSSVENEISISTISNPISNRDRDRDRDRGGQLQIDQTDPGPDGMGQGQGLQVPVPMDYSRFFHSLALMNMNAQAQARLTGSGGGGGGGSQSNAPYSHPLLPPMLHPDHSISVPRWGFLNMANRSFWTKYCLLCTVCGSAATILAGIFLVIAVLFRYYTTSVYYFETVPTYIPAILLSICGVSTIAFSCKRNRNIILLRITACWSLVSAALASVITITTSLIHMNRLQTLRECVYNPKPSPPSCSCVAHTVTFDTFGNKFEPVHYVFENTPDCDVINGTLYSCLRAVFAISVVAVLLSIFLCMLLYQLIGHERKKAYWSRVRRTNSDWSTDFMSCLPRPMTRDRSSMMPLVVPPSMSMPLSPSSMSMAMGGGPGGGGYNGNGPLLPFPHPGLFAWGPPPPYEEMPSQEENLSRQLPSTSTTTVTVNVSPSSRRQQQTSSNRSTSSRHHHHQRQRPTNFVALPPIPPVPHSSSSSSSRSRNESDNRNQQINFNYDRRTAEEIPPHFPVITVSAFSPTITSMDFTSSRLLQTSTNPIPISNNSKISNSRRARSINSNSGHSAKTLSNDDDDAAEELPTKHSDDEALRLAMSMSLSMSMTVTPPDSFRDTETDTDSDRGSEIQQIRKDSHEILYRCPDDFASDDIEAEGEIGTEEDKLLQILLNGGGGGEQGNSPKATKTVAVVASIHNQEDTSAAEADPKESDTDIGNGMESCNDKDSVESLSLSLLSESESLQLPLRSKCPGSGCDLGVQFPVPNSSSVSAPSPAAAAEENSNFNNLNSTKNRIVRSFRLEKITSLPNSPILMNVRKFCSFRYGHGSSDKDRHERGFGSVAKLSEVRDRLDRMVISSSISNTNVHCHSHPISPEHQHEIMSMSMMMLESSRKNRNLSALASSPVHTHNAK